MKRYGTNHRVGTTRPGPEKPTETSQISPSEVLAGLRIQIFNQALQTLAIVKTLNEESSTMHPARAEINEALKVVREALITAGLDLVRPIMRELKKLSATTEKTLHDPKAVVESAPS